MEMVSNGGFEDLVAPRFHFLILNHSLSFGIVLLLLPSSPTWGKLGTSKFVIVLVDVYLFIPEFSGE